MGCRARVVAARLLVLLLVVLPGAGIARGGATPAPSPEVTPASPPEAAPAEPEAISLPRVAEEADHEQERIKEALARIAPEPGIEKVVASFGERRALLAEKRAKARAVLDGATTLDVLADLEREWTQQAQDLAAWRRSVTRRATALEEALDELKSRAEIWQRTRSEAIGSRAPKPLVDRIDGILADLKGARRAGGKRRRELLSLQNEIAKEELQVAELQERVRGRTAEIRSRLLDPDSPPLWSVWWRERAQTSPAARVRAALERESSNLVEFIVFARARLGAHAVLLLAFYWIMVALRSQADRIATENPRLSYYEHLFDRPGSTALLAALLATPWVHPLAPAIVRNLAGLALVVPLLRLLPLLVHQAFLPLLWALAGFYLLDRLRDLVEAVPLAERLIFAGELAAGVALMYWLLRPARLARVPRDVRLPRALGGAIRIGLVLLALAWVANLLGYFGLSKILGEGVLVTAYVGVAAYAGLSVATALVEVSLHTATLRRLRVIERRGEIVRRYGRRALRLATYAVASLAVLGAFGVREPALEGLRAIVTTSLQIGTVSVSLGDVVAFVLAVTAALTLSQVIRAVLEDEVYTRIPLRRGVPAAISATVHYGLLLLGFFLALGAAGVDFGRFTVLAGALGVGIGFGLQNVVNNFVSGLILLYERPIQVGDTVQLETMLGTVQRIGIRSSTVRTFEGAEVIVPNSTLIAEQVTNWTLSDRRRRIDVSVGVAYGTEPERVLSILRGVGAAHPHVLQDPAPEALFVGFGDSSLDFQLRAWVVDYYHVFTVRSELYVAVCRAIREAGIEIPFPQRDLHLRSAEVPLSVVPVSPDEHGPRR